MSLEEQIVAGESTLSAAHHALLEGFLPTKTLGMRKSASLKSWPVFTI